MTTPVATAARQVLRSVEPAGDVRTGDQGQHRVVVAELPAAVRLAEVGVQVNHDSILAAG
jgi:hypothetical protein